VVQKSRPAAAELLADPGVVEPVATLEVFGFAAVRRVGGTAVLPHRGHWLTACSAGIEAAADWDSVTTESFDQAVVHLQKGRDATWEGLFRAWSHLASGGRMLLAGGNALGVKSAIKRLGSELGRPGEIVANRAHARVAVWVKRDGPDPEPPTVAPIQIIADRDRFTLQSVPGAFSADGLDPGTALLLERLDQLEPAEVVFDPGCGLGALGLTTLRRWPAASAVLADVDHRAVSAVRASATDLGLADRCDIVWWDAATDPPPVESCDLVLLNPPFHSGVPVDLQPARAIFKVVGDVLVRGGRALVVANRTLPWERDLRQIGQIRQIRDAAGYKVIEVNR
jgi:16S rRNA (guanine1207-N2)-methyltransferase